MTKTNRRLAMALAAMTAFGIIAWPARAQAQDLMIGLKIEDYAGFPQDALRGAQTQVDEIFRQAGIRTAWGVPGQFTIIILSAEMTAQIKGQSDQMGFVPTVGTGHIAYVLGGRVAAAASEHRADESAVLAVVIAHELGHLVLPPHAHAPAGVMRASWNGDDLRRATGSNVCFMTSQTKQLRKALMPEQLAAR